jgi:carbon storage regulator
MRILSLIKGETIVIDGEITVTVVEIRKDKVRLAVCGPRERLGSVHRKEVWEAIYGKAPLKKVPDRDG